MMTLFGQYPLAAGWDIGELLNIIIVVIVVVIAPLTQWLIKFFTPIPKDGPGEGSTRREARPAPQHRARPTAQAMPVERMPVPPARPARPIAQPLPSGRHGPAMEQVRPLNAPDPRPVARRADVDDDEASKLPEVLLEMLGVPAEEVRRRIMQERQAHQQRKQQRKQAAREAKTADARPKLSAPPPPRRVDKAPREPERHVSIHTDLPSEQRGESALPSKSKGRRDEAAASGGTSASAARGLARLARADKSELRRAILLNEVLGPPISLRPPTSFQE